MSDERIPVVPVDIQIFSIEEVAEILRKQNPGELPQWQFHGGPIATTDGIRQVMMKLDRVRPPDIITPAGGPLLVR